MDQKYFAPVILLIICSSIVSPILLKVLFKKDKGQDDGNAPDKNEEAAKELEATISAG